ncbi:MAG TPA: LysR substrate-binding domain-containing protein [Azospirillum sp.]
MIEVRHLRYFRAVAEDLHFGRAAARLHVAQPALTRQIQRLEEEVGVLLLKRTQRSVELTPAGALFFERATMILEEIAKAGADARRVEAGEYGRLTVGFIHSSTYGLMPAVLERFHHMYPDVELDLREMTVAEQLDALVRGTIDVGLLRPPATDPRIAMIAILEEGFLLVVPRKHPLADAAGVSLDRLAGEPFIMFSQRQSPLFHSRIMRMCESAGFSPNVVQHATQIHTVLGLVGAGMGVAVVPETARNLRISGTRFLRIQHAPEPVHVSLAWRRDNETPAVRSFRQVALLVAQQTKADG